MPNWRAPWAALIVQRGRLWKVGETMKLRSMRATVEEWKDVDVMVISKDGGDYIKHFDRCKALKSYISIVAIYGYGEIYLLPRYDYSVTTWKHVHAFIQDHCHALSDGDAWVIRKRAKREEMGYHFASHFAFMHGFKSAVWATH